MNVYCVNKQWKAHVLETTGLDSFSPVWIFTLFFHSSHCKLHFVLNVYIYIYIKVFKNQYCQLQCEKFENWLDNLCWNCLLFEWSSCYRDLIGKGEHTSHFSRKTYIPVVGSRRIGLFNLITWKISSSLRICWLVVLSVDQDKKSRWDPFVW